MTPAVQLLTKQNIAFKIHEYEHDPNQTSFGEEAVEKLAVAADLIFKTLIVELDNSHLAVAIIPVRATLNLKRLAKALKVKKLVMAKPSDVQRSSGYVLGGVSPLGQKKQLLTVIDLSAHVLATVFVSGGRRGLEIELSPQILASLTKAKFANITDV